MTIIGISIELQQDDDFRLYDVLKPVFNPSWVWHFSGGENYLKSRTENPWDLTPFLTDNRIYDGPEFIELINTPRQYIIFADLKAFPTKETVEDVYTYDEFLSSACQLAAIVVDGAYVMLIAKDVSTLTNNIKGPYQYVYREDLTHLSI